MSDTSAPAPSAPANSPAPAATPNETPINPSQPTLPNPVGPQTAPAPEGRSRSDTIRGSLQAAFDRANSPPPKDKPAPKPAPKAAEAKAGHNNPPEETPKLNLRKAPDAQEIPRDKGRFAPRSASATSPTPEANATKTPEQAGNIAQNGAQPGQQEYRRLPPHAPYAEPPARMAEHGKRDWANTPETVRGEVDRMNGEFSKAIQQYQGVAEAFRPVARFHQMALQHGTTLEQALHNYTTIENKLRQDPIAGLDQIVNNLGLKDPKTGQKIGLRDIAHYVLNSSPEQLRQVQQGNQQQAAAHQIGALYNEITGLKQAVQQMHTQQQFTHVRSALDIFADTHPRLDELGVPIEQELKLGFDLETAYRRAELLYPATHAAQTRDPPAQTRQTDRSISGNPGVAPSNGASRKQKPSGSPREALQNAMARLNS
jgi:hypothetical protein